MRQKVDWRARAACAGLAAAIAAAGAAAQETVAQETTVAATKTEDGVPVIVVTAERREVSELDVAQHVTVVTSDRIVEQGGLTTPDALREAPGVWIQKTGYGGGSPFIRGLTGKQVLILVNGIRLNNSALSTSISSKRLAACLNF